jgi:predicted N-acyltransferase
MKRILNKFEGYLNQKHTVDCQMVTQDEITIAKTVDKISGSIDEISDDSFFTYGWFKTLESFRRIPDPYYLRFGHEGETVGIAPCFVDKTDDFFSWGPNIFPYFHRLLRIGHKLGLFNRDLLLCYSPACCRTKVLLDNRYSAEKVVTGFSRKIDDLCRKEKILFSSFLFVSEFDKKLMKTLEDANYVKFTNIMTYYLKIQWTQFDDYLKSLKPGMAKKIRREIRKCLDNGVSINEEQITQEIAEELSLLNANVSSKHSGEDTVYRLDPSFFMTLQKFAQKKVKLFTARKDQKIIGFSIALHHKDTLDVYMYGSDYESQTNTFFTYFNLVYYKPIQLAIDTKLKKIYFRYFLAKSRLDRGCTPEQTYSYMKCQYPFLGSFINRFLRTNQYRKLKLQLLTDYFPK